jgi:anti-sigma regulatory factor (Ser/Thr protein kinase)
VEFLAVVREAARASVEEGHLTDDALYRLSVVLSEVVTNAVEASAEASSVDPVLIVWSLIENGIEVSVTDAGTGFDPGAAASRTDPISRTELGPEGGFGLGLIRSYADDYSFRTGCDGTEVRFVIKNG